MLSKLHIGMFLVRDDSLLCRAGDQAHSEILFEVFHFESGPTSSASDQLVCPTNIPIFMLHSKMS
jgi:hypothetical protein